MFISRRATQINTEEGQGQATAESCRLPRRLLAVFVCADDACVCFSARGRMSERVGVFVGSVEASGREQWKLEEAGVCELLSSGL